MNATDTNFGGVLVDYGPRRRSRAPVTEPVRSRRRTGGARRARATRLKYLQVEKRLTNVTQWRVSKGILDALNRNSYAVAELLTPDQEESSTFRCCPRTTPSGRVTGSAQACRELLRLQLTG